MGTVCKCFSNLKAGRGLCFLTVVRILSPRLDCLSAQKPGQRVLPTSDEIKQRALAQASNLGLSCHSNTLGTGQGEPGKERESWLFDGDCSAGDHTSAKDLDGA